MNVLARPNLVTFDEFYARIKDWEKADLIDGVIYMASPENVKANDLFMWLGRLLGDFVEEKKLGRLNGSRLAFKLDLTNSPEPDIAFVRRNRVHLFRETFFDGPPDLAIEIVCPESVQWDYETKRRQYEQFGVREYWIIDDIEKRVTLLRLGPDGLFRASPPRKGKLHSHVLKGFWLKPEWLWQRPLPRKSKILKEILA